MPFYVYAWITDFFYGLSSITGKLASKHQIKNVWQINFIWCTLSCLLILPFALAGGVQWPTHWAPLWIFGIASALSGTFWLLTLYRLDVSAFAPLYSFRVVFSLLMGILLFGERLSTMQFVYVGIIFCAGLFVNLDERLSLRSVFQKSMGLALLAVFFSAVLGVVTKYAMTYEGYWEVTFWGSVLSVVPLIVTIPLFWKDIKKTHVYKYTGTLASVVVAVIGFLAVNKAYAENVGITSAILSVPSSMIMAFLFSVFAPKLLEKHTMKVYAFRFAATAIMIVAALRLSM